MNVVSKIVADLTRPNIGARVNAVQGDGNTRLAEITLLCGGVTWTPPEGVEAAIAYYQPGGTKGLYNKLADGTAAISITGNVVTVILAPQMLTVSGTVQASLVFNDSQLNRLTTFPFAVSVASNPSVGAQKTEDYIRLQWLEDKLDEYLRKAADSGEFDGEPGAPGQDYVLTEADKIEIAEMAAGMVEVPDSGGNVDLTGYATEQFVRDGYQPKGNYLTEVPEGYAKTTDIPTKPEDIGALPDTYTPPNQTAEQVGADPKGTAETAVSQHNTNTDAHNDIRLELKAINDKLTAFFDSDDQTLDELSEIVAYITGNKTLIESITTSKVSITDIIDNLTTNVSNKPLSAAQGAVLKGLIDTLSSSLSNYQPTGDYALRSELPIVPAWAKQPNKPTYTAAEVGALPDTYTPPNQTAQQVGADPVGTAASTVSQHNTDAAAHNDLRLALQELANRINAALDSDDATLDQMSEVVAYIKSNKSLIDAITTSKVSVADIVNDLVTNAADKPLSAAQGVAIKTLIDTLRNDKLDATELTNAVNTALAQAKASGEFDGADGKSAYQYAQDGGYTGTEAEFAAKMAQEIPTTLPNPNALTFTGSVFGTYDGSSAVTINIPDSSGDTIPDYVIAEAEATIAKSFSHGNLGRTIRFIAISDPHYNAYGDTDAAKNIQIGIKHLGMAVKYISDRVGLDFMCCLGDTTWAGEDAADYTMDMIRGEICEVNSLISDGFRGVPNVRICGNHDQFWCSSDSKRLWNSGAHSLLSRYNCGQQNGLGGYGYFDLDGQKVRVMYLNTSDCPDATAAGTRIEMSQAQKNWVAETLIDLNTKADAGEWKILILSHVPLDYASANIAADILLAYVNGGSYNSYSFAANSAQIIGNCHGHMHCFNVGYLADKVVRWCTPNSCYILNNHYKSNTGMSAWSDTTTYAKTAGSGKDTAFSIVTIDLDSGMCYVDNYGAGIDREFSYGYKVSDPVAPAIDNLIGTLGVQENTRLNSSGLAKVDSRSTGYYMINFIPVSAGDVIRVKGFTIPTSANETSLALYSSADESTKLFYVNWSTANAGVDKLTFRYDGDLVTITALSTLSAGYLRFDAKPTTTIGDCIVTRNQEIS